MAVLTVAVCNGITCFRLQSSSEHSYRVWKKNHKIPSGKRLHSYGKSPFLMGKSTISMAIFNSNFDTTRGYVRSTETQDQKWALYKLETWNILKHVNIMSRAAHKLFNYDTTIRLYRTWYGMVVKFDEVWVSVPKSPSCIGQQFTSSKLLWWLIYAYI